MQKNRDIETARNILHNAVNMNFSKEIILKISQKIDRYVVAYYQSPDNSSWQEQEHPAS